MSTFSSPRRLSPNRLLLALFLGGLALSILASVLIRLPSSSASVGFVVLCTIKTVPAPEFPQVLTTFAVEPVAVFLLGAAAIGYMILFQRVRRTPLARQFPRWRALCYLSGVALVLVTVFGPFAAYDHTFLSIHMLQHFLLITIAPPLILAGAPLTLLLISAGRKARAQYFYPVLHSRVFHKFTNPLVGLALFALIPTAWYVTPLFERSLTNEWLHYLGYSVFLFAGLHYWWPIVPANPTRWHIAYPVRLVYLLALVPIHAFLGTMFYEPDRVMYPQLSQIPRAWGPGPLMDQQAAGAFMFIAGEMIGLIALLIVAGQWASAEERATVRKEEAEARRRAAESAKT
jgi:putative copper resistance protein D